MYISILVQCLWTAIKNLEVTKVEYHQLAIPTKSKLVLGGFDLLFNRKVRVLFPEDLHNLGVSRLTRIGQHACILLGIFSHDCKILSFYAKFIQARWDSNWRMIIPRMASMAANAEASFVQSRQYLHPSILQFLHNDPDRQIKRIHRHEVAVPHCIHHAAGYRTHLIDAPSHGHNQEMCR